MSDVNEKLLRVLAEQDNFDALTPEQKELLRKQIVERLDPVEQPVVAPQPVREEISEEERLATYTTAMQKLKIKSPREELYEQDLLSGLDNPATLADIKKSNTDLWLRVQQSLASVGGGGMGENAVEELVNTTVINNFGLAPLDSSGNPVVFDSADVIGIVDSDYVKQRLPKDVKVRFRLDPTTPVILNSSGVTSVTTFQSGQSIKFDVNFETPFASGDDYITMLTLDQEGTDRVSTLIPPVNAESRVPVVIQQTASSVRVVVEKTDTADNQDEGVLNVKIFEF
jgi:hypothetical protein